MLKIKTHQTSEIKPGLEGEKVTTGGWVSKIRDLGGIRFFLLRDSSGQVQITAKQKRDPKQWERITELGREDVVLIKGIVRKSEQAPGGREIVPREIKVLSKAESPLPVDPTGKVKAELDTRLDHRVIDLRRSKNVSAFKMRARATQVFREFFINKGFTEIQTPYITATATEGGAAVFPVVYYDRQAFLRQSPQLYKQMMVGVFERVFETGDVFRAEPHHTTRHLSEYCSCDFEKAWIEGEEDLMRMQEDLLRFMLKRIRKEFKKELESLKIKVEIPEKPFPEVRFPEVYQLLESEFGKEIPYGEDLDPEAERLLGRYAKEEFGNDFIFVRAHPWKIRPFYTMKASDPEFTKSVDLLFKGLEITTGSQREHRYDVLVKQIKGKGLNPKDFKYYLEVFRFGIPTHGGIGFGMARFMMQLLGFKNIREAVLLPRAPERLNP